jgi:hypothetical protein
MADAEVILLRRFAETTDATQETFFQLVKYGN